MGGGQEGAVLGSEPEGLPPRMLEAELGTAADTANLLALEWELDALIVRGARWGQEGQETDLGI